jgi:hypothetical protein
VLIFVFSCVSANGSTAFASCHAVRYSSICPNGSDLSELWIALPGRDVER